MEYDDEIIRVPRFEEGNGFYTTESRSKIMSKISGKDTKPEMIMRKLIWRAGLRYRLHMKSLPGKPDIIFTRAKVAIFIDGEFWHGYNWEEKKGRLKSNRDFWIPKIERNMQRDRINNQLLAILGYTVVRFWEHEVKRDPLSCLEKVLKVV